MTWVCWEDVTSGLWGFTTVFYNIPLADSLCGLNELGCGRHCWQLKGRCNGKEGCAVRPWTVVGVFYLEPLLAFFVSVIVLWVYESLATVGLGDKLWLQMVCGGGGCRHWC